MIKIHSIMILTCKLKAMTMYIVPPMVPVAKYWPLSLRARLLRDPAKLFVRSCLYVLPHHLATMAGFLDPMTGLLIVKSLVFCIFPSTIPYLETECFVRGRRYVIRCIWF